MQESRTHKSLLNARVNLIFYFISLTLAFFSRKIFLDCLGADFIGLTGTIGNLLSFLNLTELGIGIAISVVLYKPLFEQNRNKINEIISVLGFLYQRIGFIILIAGIILACFLPLIFKNSGLSSGIIYFTYASYLIASLLTYFINYKQTLLSADQRKYVINIYSQSAKVIKTIVQIGLTIYTHNYYYWILMELIFGICYCFILNWKIKETYPWLDAEIKRGKVLLKDYPEITIKIKQLFIHKSASLVQYEVAPLLIYAFTSLKTVAYYGNYMIIFTALNSLLYNVSGGADASVGNLIAENNKHKTIQIFWELKSIIYFITGTICFCCYYLSEPFITLWLGKEYILEPIILKLILIKFFIDITRSTVSQFINGHGLFSDVWAPIIEAIISLTVSVIGGYFWGLPGVLAGPIISLLIIVCLWKPYFLYHHVFYNLSFKRYIANTGKLLLLILCSWGISICLIQLWSTPADNIFCWIIYAMQITGIYVFISYIFFYIFTLGIRNCTQRIIKLILGR